MGHVTKLEHYTQDPVECIEAMMMYAFDAEQDLLPRIAAIHYQPHIWRSMTIKSERK
jgi:hypothetical protein